MPTVFGNFEIAGDTDWFRARFEAGHTYTISADGNFSLELMLPDGSLYMPPLSYSNLIGFVAPVTGDYWISANNYGGDGFYSFSVSELADPHPGSVSTDLTMTIGIPVQELNPIAQDWYAVDLVAGQTYFFNEDSGYRRDIYLANDQGELVSPVAWQVHFTPTESGRYFLAVDGWGQYRVTSTVIADDHPDGIGGAGTLTVGGQVTGQWESGMDSDAYAITLTAGNSYQFTFSTPYGPWGDNHVTVQDAAGNLVTIGMSGNQAFDGTTSGSAFFSPTVGGTYYVSAVAGAALDPAQSWTYALSATQLSNDLTDNILTSGSLSLGTPSTGDWAGSGDGDWFAVSLTAGQSYQFGLTSNVGDTQIVLYDSAGNEVLSPEEGYSDTSNLLVQTVATTGTYYIGVSVQYADSGSYTLTGSSFVDDFANNSATTGTIIVGGTTSGSFEANGDRDWFAVQLTAGASYSFSGVDDFVALAIRDAQGNELTHFNWNDTHFSPLASGTYYLEAVGNIGSYIIEISQVSDDYREDMLSSGVVRYVTSGTSGNDIFISTAQHEQFGGGDGDDLFVAGEGYDWYHGGSGTDSVSFMNFTTGVNVNLGLLGLFESDVRRIKLTSIENVEGSNFDDVISGNAQSNLLNGGSGNDLLDGGSGDDILIGGAGNDTYIVDSTGDQVVEAAGEEGSDTVRTSVSYGLAAGVSVENLQAFDAASQTGLTLVGNEFGQTIIGTAGADLLIASAGNDTVFGGAGDDQIDGGYGNDILYGGAGDDVMVGREDDDLLIGSEGNDLMIGDIGSDAIDGGSGNDRLFGGEGNDVLVGREDNDLLFGSEGDDLLIGDIGDDQLDGGTGNDTLDGGEGNDVLVGREGDDLLLGSGGNDLLIGSDGNDLIDGGSGADMLDGGEGNDVLNGGGGTDVLLGGAGADLFAFRDLGGMVTILDFASGSDRIDLTSMDANIVVGGDQAFVYLGDGAFTNTAGQLRNYSDGSSNYLLGDIDGNGSADLVINLGSAHVSTADLLL